MSCDTSHATVPVHIGVENDVPLTVAIDQSACIALTFCPSFTYPFTTILGDVFDDAHIGLRLLIAFVAHRAVVTSHKAGHDTVVAHELPVHA